MKRSIRRHQQRVAKFRRIRILRSHGAWAPHRWEPKVWRPLSRLVMNEPGWWIHDFVIRPARSATKSLEHRLERGGDTDAPLWPDYKRPHVYYW